MMEMSLSKQIDAPAEVIFSRICEIEKWPERIKGIAQVEKLTSGQVGVGTRFRETRVMYGCKATEEMEFTAFDPNRGYTLSCSNHGCLYTSAFRFEPNRSGTLVTLDFACKPLTIVARLFTPLSLLMKGTLRKCMEQDLEDLKVSAEKGT